MTLVSSFIRTLFTSSDQTIFAFVIFVKLALRFPRLTLRAPLFFHAINNPMALLVYGIFSERPAVSEFFAPVIASTLSAHSVQTVFFVPVTTKLAPVFPLLASTAPFQFCFNLCHGHNYSDIRDNWQLNKLRRICAKVTVDAVMVRRKEEKGTFYFFHTLP